MNLILRRISILGAVLLIVLSIVISKKMAGKAKKHDAENAPVVRAAAVTDVKNTIIPSDIEVTGKLAAAKRMEIFSEVNGILMNANFKEGVGFGKGGALVVIDDAEARAQLKALKGTFLGLVTQMLADLSIDYPEDYKLWKKFQESISFDKDLPEMPESANAQVRSFLSGRNIYTNYYNIKSQELRLTKYRIIAPFSGTISQALVDQGALVRQGQKIGEFINSESFELEASVSLNDMKFVRLGDKVSLTSDEMEGTWTGTLIRMNDKLDASSQSVMIYIQVQGKNLKEGMYLSAGIKADPIKDAFEIPRKLLFNGNKLYVVESDSLLKIKSVQIERYKRDRAIIKGLPDGTKLLVKSIPGSYEDMIVKQVQE